MSRLFFELINDGGRVDKEMQKTTIGLFPPNVNHKSAIINQKSPYFASCGFVACIKYQAPNNNVVNARSPTKAF